MAGVGEREEVGEWLEMRGGIFGWGWGGGAGSWIGGRVLERWKVVWSWLLGVEGCVGREQRRGSELVKWVGGFGGVCVRIEMFLAKF